MGGILCLFARWRGSTPTSPTFSSSMAPHRTHSLTVELGICAWATLLLRLPFFSASAPVSTSAFLSSSSPSAPGSSFSTPSSQVYMMEPPMFVEGSKTGIVMTTVEPGSPFGPPL